jgi:hypothetical protein
MMSDEVVGHDDEVGEVESKNATTTRLKNQWKTKRKIVVRKKGQSA